MECQKTEWRKSPLSKKHNITLDELEKRKKRLERELEQIQDHLDDSMIQTRESFISGLNPAKKIRKVPFKAVGIALLAGFLAGFPRRRNKGKGEHDHDHETVRTVKAAPQKSSMAHHMFDEMKHIAARRAAHYLMDTVNANLKAGVHKARAGENQTTTPPVER